MRISETFSGKYLKAADLPSPRVLTIQSVGMESIGEEKSSKPVIRFQGEQRGLVANKVNSLELSSWYGDDTSGWIGQTVELFTTTTFFSGRQVPCIRVRKPAVQFQQQPVQQAPQQLYTQPQYQLHQPAQPQPVQPQLQQPAVPPVPFDA